MRMKGKEYNWSFDHQSARIPHPVGRSHLHVLLDQHREAFLDLIHNAASFANLFCISADPSVAMGVAVSTSFQLPELKSLFAVKTIVSESVFLRLKQERIEHVTTLRHAIESGDSSPLIHGLRAPVSRMVGLIDLLARDHSLNAEAKEYVSYLMKTAGRMRRTVDYLLMSSADPSCEEALRLTFKSGYSDSMHKWLSQPKNGVYCEILTLLSGLGLFVPGRSEIVQECCGEAAETISWELNVQAVLQSDSLTLLTKLFASRSLTDWLLKNPGFSVLVATDHACTLVMVRRSSSVIEVERESVALSDAVSP